MGESARGLDELGEGGGRNGSSFRHKTNRRGPAVAPLRPAGRVSERRRAGRGLRSTARIG
ncbi:MAG: hypothetical protein AMXMBFR36_34740 [Acidobacteriota bacterium]